jgi:hypothetical protein
MRLLLSGICLAWSVAQLDAATLFRLSLDDMINQCTAIVHVKVSGSSTAFRGSIIYTWYHVQVLERWKGPDQAALDVALPGGTVNNYRQAFPGSPQLVDGNEYLLFLWTSKSGLTQIIGLTQGLFDLSRDSSGAITAVRGASTNSMLDPATGKVVRDLPIRMQLKDMTSLIANTLGKGATN